VLLHAPKNGFFYVLDRRTGELLSAKNFVPVSWASHIELPSGRPAVNSAARYGTDPVLVTPGPGGAHNWFPMAFNPRTRLAYLPIYEHWFVYALDPGFIPRKFRSNGGWGGFTGEALQKRVALQKEADRKEKAWLLAWDPVKQEARGRSHCRVMVTEAC
jgi:quinohemoprotein ethanol dehydrogenase